MKVAATESINRRLKVASLLVRQAVELIEKEARLDRAAPDDTEPVDVDSQLIAELQLGTTALRRAWNVATQTSQERRRLPTHSS